MSIAHGAPFANGAYPPIPPGEGIGEGITSTGEPIERREGIGDTLARLADRLAVVAVSAHIMERRAPFDCYARSIARETHALTVELRETIREARDGAPMRAPRIVDAVSSTDGEPDATPDGEPRPYDPQIDRYTDWSSHPAFRVFDDTPDVPPASPSPTGATARRSTVQKRRQTPPHARHAAPACGSSERTPASPQPSLASSGASGGESGAPRRAGGAQ